MSVIYIYRTESLLMNYNYVYTITVEDPMFLGMQDFDFYPNLINV